MNNPVCRKVTVSNPQGIHLRPAYLIAELAGKFESDVSLELAGTKVDGKSVLEIIGLAASNGSELNILADDFSQVELLKAFEVDAVSVDAYNAIDLYCAFIALLVRGAMVEARPK